MITNGYNGYKVLNLVSVSTSLGPESAISESMIIISWKQKQGKDKVVANLAASTNTCPNK